MRSTLLSSRSTHFFRLYNGVNPSGVRHICHNMISQVSLSCDDVVFAVLGIFVLHEEGPRFAAADFLFC